VQRLFSTFANGWPGIGLFMQRLVTGTAVMYFVVMQHNGTPGFASSVPQILGVGAAILLIIGLWTPVVGAVIAMVEAWTVLSHAADPWIPILLATFGLSLAMIGPGAWAVDARLFGRKHIET
jgi:uncharacterized membrane protein YphA (DoxX/SURF4 family)